MMKHDIYDGIAKCVKMHRKACGMSADKLAAIIHRDRSTIWKYENGETHIDMNTLVDIADAFNVELSHLVITAEALCKGDNETVVPASKGDPRTYHMYFYDGRLNQLTKSAILLTPMKNGSDFSAVCFYDFADFDKPKDCTVIYSGTAKDTNLCINFDLQNTVNEVENVFLVARKPFQASNLLYGIIIGISQKDFQPIGFHVVLSEQRIADEKSLVESLKFHKKDFSAMRDNNGFIFLDS